MRTGTIKTIDEKDYEIWHIPAKEGSEIILKLAKLVLEPLGVGFGKQKLASLEDVELDFGNIVTTLSSRLNETDVQQIMQTLFKYVHIKTETGGFIPVDINRDFTGKIMHMYKVFFSAMEVNFADFLSELKGSVLAGSIIKKIQTKSSEKPM